MWWGGWKVGGGTENFGILFKPHNLYSQSNLDFLDYRNTENMSILQIQRNHEIIN